MQEIDVSLCLLSQLSLLNKENSQQLQEVIYLFFEQCQGLFFTIFINQNQHNYSRNYTNCIKNHH